MMNVDGQSEKPSIFIVMFQNSRSLFIIFLETTQLQSFVNFYRIIYEHRGKIVEVFKEWRWLVFQRKREKKVC